jgi:CSLREA domain-containing protein
MPTIWLAVSVACVLLTTAWVVGSQSLAQANTFTVNTPLDAQDADPGDGACETAPGNGVCSLRAAVQESNAQPGADVIVLPAGVYTLTLAGALENDARFGDLDIHDDLTLEGAGAAITVIDGNQLDRVIDLSQRLSVVEISGLTIRNGNVDFPDHFPDNPPWLGESGGCLLSLAGLTIRDSVVTNCRAGRQGGGIYAEEALALDNTMVSGNQAGEEGGGVFIGAVYVPTSPTVQPPITPVATPVAVETPPTAPALPTSTPVLLETPTPTPTWTPFVFETPTPRETPTMAPPAATALPAAPIAVLRNCVIEHNSAMAGGGVYNRGWLEMTGVVLRHNQAVAPAGHAGSPDGSGYGPSGGGVYSQGSLALMGSQIISNTADGLGGGLVSEAWAEVEGSFFAGNQAGAHGGGIFSTYWLRLSLSTVRDNWAGEHGGGIVNHHWGGSFAPMLILERSTVSGNASQGRGGGIANGVDLGANDYRQEHLWLVNSTVSGNAAGGSGGGIYTGLGTLNGVFLDNDTIAANVADADGDGQGDGGGIFNRLGAVQLRNTVLARNQDLSPTIRRPDCWTPRRFESRGYNLIGDASTCPLDGVTAGNLLGADPRLGPLHDNGGDTQTHALLAGSPAVDAGNPDGCVGEFSGYLTVDQRGNMRTVDGDGDGQGVCDIGAYEYGAAQPVYRYLPLLLAQ